MRYIVMILVLLFSLSASSQVKQVYNQYGGTWKRLEVKVGFRLPLLDSSTKDGGSAAFDSAQVYYNPTDSTVYYYTGFQWLAMGSGSGGGGGIDTDYVDTTFIKVVNYTADQKRGNVLGTLYEQTGFANLDTFVTSGAVTATISNSMIKLGDGSADQSVVTLKRYTMLNRWTLKSGFKIGQQDGDSYSFNIGMASANSSYVQNIIGVFHHRSTPSENDGFLTLQDGSSYSNLLATSATAVAFSVGDSIEVTLNRNINIFTFTARNVTLDGAEISVSYTYTGYTTAVNMGRPFLSATGIDSVYYFHYYSTESTGADLITVGDSKFTWYGKSINEAIPSQFYALNGNVVSYSGSGNKTAEVVLSTDALIALGGRQWLVNIGSNDIRNSIVSGVWQANIDTIYNRGTAAGVDVYFALAYETDVSQTDIITYLEANYPTRYIPGGYDTILNCGSCLQSDGIHLTSYADSIWVEAVVQAGLIDFSSSGVAWNEISNPTGNQALTFGVGKKSTWTDQNTTQDLFTVNNATSISNSMFSLNRTSTALDGTGTNNVAELTSLGANVTNSAVSNILRIDNKNTGTGSINNGITIDVSGGSTNNALTVTAGRTGLGDITPQTILQVGSDAAVASGFGTGAQILFSNGGSATYIAGLGPSGSEAYFGAESGKGVMGMLTNHPYEIRTNNITRAVYSAAGAYKLNAYGSGTFTGTPARYLAVESDGDVIEATASSLKPSLNKGAFLEAPGSSEAMDVWQTPVAITISSLKAILRGSSPSVTYNVKFGTDITSATDVFTADITCTSVTTGCSNSSGFNDATIPAGSFIWIATTASSGTITSISWTINYTED